jgi:histone deacetylase 1/2
MNVLSSDPDTPRDWKDYWFNEKNRKQWTDSVCTEIENFLKRDAWTLYPRSKLESRKPIKSKYVFKIKNEPDGSVRLKTRIVIKGYTQIPGVDFNETYSPVANDTSIRVTLSYALYKMKDGWAVHVIDIEAAFLEADLEEEIVAEWPEGLKELGYTTEELERDYCILLNKAMYGTVQAPRAFFLTLSKHLKEMGMVQSKVDPCIWYKRDYKGELVLIMAIYVDDCILSGKEEAVTWCKERLKERFNITDLRDIKKHIGVNYELLLDGNDEPYYKLSMDEYTEKLIRDGEDLLGTIKKARTPGIPGIVLPKVTENEDPIEEAKYRSITGTALYLIKKIGPEATNAIREISQHLDRPGAHQWKAIMRCIGYLKEEPPYLILRKPKDLRITAYTDSNYATDALDRKSVSGYIVTLGGTIVSWVSKKQDIVALSSCEAEYISSVLCAQEIRFVQQLNLELSGNNEPAIMYGDNNGAIFMSNHSHVGPRTKHIDVRYHFIRQLIEEGKLIYKKIKGDENPADILTKNVNENLLTKHRDRIRNGSLPNPTEAIGREDVEVCAEVTVGKINVTDRFAENSFLTENGPKHTTTKEQDDNNSKEERPSGQDEYEMNKEQTSGRTMKYLELLEMGNSKTEE